MLTVSGYMIIGSLDQREYKADYNYFLYDKTQSFFKVWNIKNQCLDFFSSVIEIFGDDAIENMLIVIQNLL